MIATRQKTTTTHSILPEMYEMVWDDNKADMETELGTMLTNIMSTDDEFKEILRSNGIILTMKIFFTFIRRPILDTEYTEQAL